MFKKTLVTLFLILLTQSAQAELGQVWTLLTSKGDSLRKYPDIVRVLVQNRLYYTSVPYIKEYLAKMGDVDKKFDRLIDEVVTHVGVRQFESLPINILKRTNAPMVRYILARKYFRQGKYANVIELLGKDYIPVNHPARPFSLLLMGTTLSIKGKYTSAINVYKDCISSTKYYLDKFNSYNRKRQLEINRDYCMAGISRAEFAAREFSNAYSSYLDIPKESPIWPEILFEEAWNSFYLKDYNRTLGKLVTYNAPLLSYMFNPEVEVLKGLTYLEMCLWGDLVKVVDDFYTKYESDTKKLNRLIKYHKKDYKYYYLTAKARRGGPVRGTKLYNQLLKNLIADPTYIEMYESFQSAREELEIVKHLDHDRLKRIFSINLREALLLQRNLIGAYVRNGLLNYYADMQKSFEQLSYMKLEFISRKKMAIYSTAKEGRARGDIRYLTRNEKQYFWSFNGEFWADELGDYVFSLKSECK